MRKLKRVSRVLDDKEYIEMMESDIAELMFRLYKLDDKPHRLFTHLSAMADRYSDPERREETKRLADLAIDSAYLLIHPPPKEKRKFAEKRRQEEDKRAEEVRKIFEQ